LQPSANPSDTPSLTPPCYIDDTGNFGELDNNTNTTITNFMVNYTYEVITSDKTGEQVISSIERALGNSMLASLFEMCPFLVNGVSRRLMDSETKERSKTLSGFSSTPQDSVDDVGCEELENNEYLCTRVTGSFTLYIDSTLLSKEITLPNLTDIARAAVQESMAESNTVLYVDASILKISYIDPNININASAKFSTTEDSSSTSFFIVPLVAGAAIIISFVAIQKFRKRSSLSKRYLADDDLHVNGKYDMSSLEIPDDGSMDDQVVIPVFHYHSTNVTEYLYQREEIIHEHGGEIHKITNEEVIDRLKPFLDESSEICGQGLIQFVAIFPKDINDEQDSNIGEFGSVTGVVGTVDAQIKLKGDSCYDPSEDDMPWPHICIKNLAVHKEARRQGIASALVQAIADYASEQGVNAIVLHVDSGKSRLMKIEIPEDEHGTF